MTEAKDLDKDELEILSSLVSREHLISKLRLLLEEEKHKRNFPFSSLKEPLKEERRYDMKLCLIAKKISLISELLVKETVKLLER